jgi:hypothetical protein
LYSWVKCRRDATRFPPLAISGSLRPSVYKIGNGPDLGGDYFTRRNTDRQRDRLIQQLHTLGYRVTLDKAA